MSLVTSQMIREPEHNTAEHGCIERDPESWVFFYKLLSMD